jgi:hypothetical protein
MRETRYTVRFAMDAKDALGRIKAGEASREVRTFSVWAFNALDADVAGGRMLVELVGEERARLAWGYGAKRDEPVYAVVERATRKLRAARRAVAASERTAARAATSLARTDALLAKLRTARLRALPAGTQLGLF